MTLLTVGSLRFNSASAAKEAAQHFRAMTKLANGSLGAGPGQDQETQFEQAFAQLAFTYLRDRAPALVPYLIGFQLVDRNDDNTKAVGFFGFRLGNSNQPLWLYAPMFFMNNRIKGQNLLYVKNQNRFVPLNEGRLNAIMQHRPSILGGGVQGSSQQNGVQQPNWRPMTIPPSRYGKSGAALTGVLDRITKLAASSRFPMQSWFTDNGGMQMTAKLAFEQVSEEDYTPLDLARKHFPAFQTLTTMVTQHPPIKHACSAFYGSDALLKLAREWQAKLDVMDKQAANLFAPLRLPEIRMTTKAGAELIEYEHVVDEVGGKRHSEMSESEREALVRDGYLLKDYRKGDEHSVAYEAVQDVKLHNPGETGIYRVLVKDGRVEEMLVVRNPYSTHQRHPWMVLVKLGSPKSWINCHPTSAFVKTDGAPERAEYTKFFDGLGERQKLRKGGTYLVLSAGGEGSVPFRVTEVLEGDQYRVSAKDYTNDEPLREPAAVRSYLPTFNEQLSQYDRKYYHFPEMVQFSDRRQTKFRTQGNTLVCPDEAKIIVLEEPAEEQHDYECCSEILGRSKGDVLQLGDLADLQMALRQKTASLKLWSDGAETRINGGRPQSQKAALFELVRDHALPEKRAREMIATAVRAHSARAKSAEFHVHCGTASKYLKEAYVEPSILTPGLSGDNMRMPEFPEQMQEQSMDIPSMPNVVEPEIYDEPIPGMAAQDTTDPNAYNNDPMQMPDDGLLMQAQQAAQQGQKELFDASSLQTMLKTMRRDIVDDEDVSHLTGAVDRLGKMLFKFYWHNDDFAERFGQADMPEMEDSISNNFESLDALVLMLEERNLSPAGSSMQIDNESVANN